MAVTVEDFVTAMLNLLPRGAAWPRSLESQFAQIMWPMAEEFYRIELRNLQLLAEMSPTTTTLLFDEIENELGLPGPCITEAQTVTERRNAMVAKYNQIGSQRKQMFIDAAALLGYTITITEYSEDSPGPQDEYAGHTLDGSDWNFVWQINAPGESGQLLQVGSPVGSPLQSFGNELLECSMRALAHDHRALFFNYT